MTGACPLVATALQGRVPRMRLDRFRVAARKLTVPASLRRLAEMPLTVAGLACVDVGVYTASITAGWIITGLTLIGLEFLATDS